MPDPVSQRVLLYIPLLQKASGFAIIIVFVCGETPCLEMLRLGQLLTCHWKSSVEDGTEKTLINKTYQTSILGCPIDF